MDGVKVVIIDVNDDQNKYTVYTDQNGEYLFTPTDGTYELKVFQVDPYISGYYLPSITVSGDTVHDITLDTVDIYGSHTVSGTVYEADGSTTVADIWVIVMDANYAWRDKTDQSGQYSIILLPGNVDKIVALAPDAPGLDDYVDDTFTQVEDDLTYDVIFAWGGV